jgi:SAM-dependent methyltransferase
VRYAFRDTDVAVQRLRFVARVFEPTTRAFLQEHGPRAVELAVDLGSGIGRTTRLLDDLQPYRLVGLDVSPTFVELTRRVGFEAIQHDVTVTPFPTGPADLLFCRFVLSHLAQPARQIQSWRRELRRDGVLLVEEVEQIETADPAFARYLETVDEVMHARSRKLAVGPELPAGFVSRLVTVEPDAARVSRMFALNLEAWRDELDPALASELAAGLAEPRHAPITWHLRQVVYEAAP